MAKQVLAFEITTDSKQAEASVGSFKKQLREANNELLNMSAQFGETSKEAINAAKKVAGLKDAIGDAKALAETFNPDKKFVALGGALQGAVAGFSALQGAMGLFGAEGKDVEKMMLKVQSAMALQQGISGIFDSIDSFKLLGNEIKGGVVKAFGSLKAAIISTGIGLLVIGIGLLVANFDKVKPAIERMIGPLKNVTDFFGKIIDAVTDFLGVTSEADRAMEALNNKTNERNKTIDQQLKVLGAMGNQEGAMHKLKQERAASEVEMLLQKTNRTQEENDKIIDLNTQRTVNEIENNNRIQKNREDLAKKNEEARLKEEERLKKQKELEDKLRLDTFIAKQKLQEADAQYLKNQEAEDIAAEKKELEKKAAIKKSQEELNAELFKLNLKHLQDVQANADAEKKIEQIKQEAKIKATVDTLNILSDVLGKESAAGKAIAISSALINTYLGITAGLKLGFPLAIPAVLAASVTGFKAVKSIIATKVPGGGGGGGSVPSMGSMAAPIKPEAQTTTLSSQSINQIGVASSRAFVLETDVTNNQERIQRLNRAARIN
jgi:chemotaxis protein histidine kinase CheA